MVVSPSYMSHQPDITQGMRAKLIDWLVDIQEVYVLESLMSVVVLLIDRYLEEDRSVRRSQLQLVGVTAMRLAYKFETQVECHTLSVDGIVEMCDFQYPREEVMRMESRMLEAISYRICRSMSIHEFLTYYIAHGGGGGDDDDDDDDCADLANYYAELMLLEYRMLEWPPSQLGATALAMARKTVGKSFWVGAPSPPMSPLLTCFAQTPELERRSGYSEDRLAPSYNAMLDAMGQKTSLRAIYRKYSRSEYGDVATRYPLPGTEAAGAEAEAEADAEADAEVE